MKITDIDVVMHDRDAGGLRVFSIRDGKLPLGVLRIHTDEGIEGINFLSYPGPGPQEIARQIVTFVKPILVGRDPLDIGMHWTNVAKLHRSVDQIAMGSVDVALWDIAGKAAGLPIHRLLGTYRDKVPAYFSSAQFDSPAEYAEEAANWKAQGWQGYKLHPPSSHRPVGEAVPFERDIDASRAVREAVGDEMMLMLDSSWNYTYPQALKVGRAIEELGFDWYEDPLPADDIYGYVKLKQHLSIPILATEITLGGLTALAPWVVERATDALRGDVTIKGGITGMMKIAHLAEAFHMNCEVHTAYNSMGNAATLHVLMAIPNGDWFEVLAFNPPGRYGLEHLNYGLAEPIEIDAEGYVHAPTKPGIGYDVDWELIDSARTGVIS